MRPLFVLALLGGAACSEPSPPEMAPDGRLPLGWIEVRLASDENPTLGADGPFVVREESGRELHRGAFAPADSPLRWASSGLALGAQELGPPPLDLQPLGDTLLSFEGVPYRGHLRLDVVPGNPEAALRVTNRLPVESYLRGVLPVEMPDRFGLAALQAQAVACRSYALYEVGARGWLYADARSQVYGGRDAETWLADRAVKETEGLILARDGRVIPAWFHSTCGGGTTAAAQVFGEPPAGVLERPVSCPDCRHSPFWSWERRVDGARVCAVTSLPPPLEAVTSEPGRFPGRPETVTVHAGGRQLTLRATDFRARLSAGEPRDRELLSTRWSRPARVDDGMLVIEGRGWGHGVGLCQYGASGFGRRGASAMVILRRYYPGADVVRLR